MSRITLSGTMPQEITNGLAPHAKDFIENPLKVVTVVCQVTVQKITEKPETNEVYPTLRIQHWEIVLPEDQPAVAKALANALGARTGAAELPFETGTEIPVREPFPEEDGIGKDPDAEAV